MGALPDAKAKAAELRDTAKWMYKATWKSAQAPKMEPGALAGRKILVFDGAQTPGPSVITSLRAAGAQPISI
ncbi:MAG TPA: hypothetical protein PK361_11385, partial [Chiayiivirga sp.]|nr:hypothetical protein [Chiayiivirga sp.]